MEKDSFHQRGKALEDLFYQKQDQRLLEKLRQDLESSDSRRSLEEATGISDVKLLDQLLAANISGESLTALGLVPLILVAWADNDLTADESAEILKISEEVGIQSGSASYQLLQSWFKEKPSNEVQTAWRNYVQSLKGKIDTVAFEQLKSTVISRAKKIAAASGGILGLGKTSFKENVMLNVIENSF